MRKLRPLSEGVKKRGTIKKGKAGQTISELYRVKKMRKELSEKEKELQTLKKILDQKEIEIKQLRDEVNYKNQQLASKDIEMETYKNVTEEKIFKLEAKIKELEARAGRQRSRG